jgi:hypothetical protein
MVSEEIIFSNRNVQWTAVSSTSLRNIWDTVVWIWTISDNGNLKFWSPARRNLHIKLKNCMVFVEVANKKFHWNISSVIPTGTWVRMDRQADGRTDVTKLTGAFRDYRRQLKRLLNFLCISYSKIKIYVLSLCFLIGFWLSFRKKYVGYFY